MVEASRSVLSGTADTELRPVKVPQGAVTKVGWVPDGMKVKGRSGVLDHVTLQARKTL